MNQTRHLSWLISNCIPPKNTNLESNSNLCNRMHSCCPHDNHHHDWIAPPTGLMFTILIHKRTWSEQTQRICLKAFRLQIEAIKSGKTIDAGLNKSRLASSSSTSCTYLHHVHTYIMYITTSCTYLHHVHTYIMYIPTSCIYLHHVHTY